MLRYERCRSIPFQQTPQSTTISQAVRRDLTNRPTITSRRIRRAQNRPRGKILVWPIRHFSKSWTLAAMARAMGRLRLHLIPRTFSAPRRRRTSFSLLMQNTDSRRSNVSCLILWHPAYIFVPFVFLPCTIRQFPTCIVCFRYQCVSPSFVLSP